MQLIADFNDLPKFYDKINEGFDIAMMQATWRGGKIENAMPMHRLIETLSLHF